MKTIVTGTVNSSGSEFFKADAAAEAPEVSTDVVVTQLGNQSHSAAATRVLLSSEQTGSLGPSETAESQCCVEVALKDAKLRLLGLSCYAKSDLESLGVMNGVTIILVVERNGTYLKTFVCNPGCKEYYLLVNEEHTHAVRLLAFRPSLLTSLYNDVQVRLAGKFGNKRTSKKSKVRRQAPLGQQSYVDRDAIASNLPSAERQRVHRFNRNMNLQTVSSSTTAEVDYAISFVFSDVRNSSEFANLYDGYRFLSLDVIMIPGYTSAIASGGASNLAGYVVVAPDYDDPNTSTISDLMQYGTRKVFPLGKTIRLKLNPRTKIGASGSTAGNMLSTRGSWYDMNDSSQPFYGLKFAFPQTNVVMSYTLIVDAHFQVRGDR